MQFFNYMACSQLTCKKFCLSVSFLQIFVYRLLFLIYKLPCLEKEYLIAIPCTQTLLNCALHSNRLEMTTESLCYLSI